MGNKRQVSGIRLVDLEGLELERIDNRMFKRIVTISLCALAFVLSWREANAQRDDTIYQTFVTDSTAANPVVFGPVQNIGQSFHQAFLNITAQSGKTCVTTNTSGGVTLLFYGSYAPTTTSGAMTFSNATLMPYKFPLSANPFSGNVVIQAVGAYPFVYIYVTGVDNTNCKYSVFYTGTVYPATPIDPNPNQNSIILNQQVSSSGDTTLIAGNATYTGINVNIYNIEISNLTSPNTVELKCGSTVLQTWEGMAAGEVVSLPYTGVAYQFCLGSSTLAINLMNATAVNIKMTYRYEYPVLVSPNFVPPTNTISLVGSAISNTTSGSGTNTLVFTSYTPKSANNLIVVGCFSRGAAYTNTSDGIGNHYSSLANFNSGDSPNTFVFSTYAVNSFASGVPATFNCFSPAGTPTQSTIVVAEFNNVLTTQDGNATATGMSMAPDSGALTTTNADDLLLSFVVSWDPMNTNMYTAGTGWTTVQANTTSGPGVIGIMQFQVVSATGMYNSTATFTNSLTWASGIFSFKSAI